jgi:hypothetical protein
MISGYEPFQQTYRVHSHTVERNVYPLPQWEPDHDRPASALTWMERHAGRRYNVDVVIDDWERFTFDDVTLMELARVTDDLRRYLVECDKQGER